MLTINNTGGQCWPGTYCSIGSAYPAECETGFYNDVWGQESCQKQCDAGYLCLYVLHLYNYKFILGLELEKRNKTKFRW